MAGFWKRMRWANESCGVDLIRDLIAEKEAELAQMYAALAKQEAKTARYRADYEVASKAGFANGS